MYKEPGQVDPNFGKKEWKIFQRGPLSPDFPEFGDPASLIVFPQSTAKRTTTKPDWADIKLPLPLPLHAHMKEAKELLMNFVCGTSGLSWVSIFKMMPTFEIVMLNQRSGKRFDALSPDSSGYRDQSSHRINEIEGRLPFYIKAELRDSADQSPFDALERAASKMCSDYHKRMLFSARALKNEYVGLLKAIYSREKIRTEVKECGSEILDSVEAEELSLSGYPYSKEISLKLANEEIERRVERVLVNIQLTREVSQAFQYLKFRIQEEASKYSAFVPHIAQRLQKVVR